MQTAPAPWGVQISGRRRRRRKMKRKNEMGGQEKMGW